MVRVLCRFVVGGYLHALELVSCWLVLGGGYLHALVVRALELVPWLVLVGSGYLQALELVPCWLVVRGWLPACLEPCVPCWLVCPLLIMPLVLGGSCPW